MIHNRKKLREHLYQQFDGKCVWCDAALTLEEATIEHFAARAVGGNNDPKNLGIACEKCNSERGVRLNRALQQERRQQREREPTKPHVLSKRALKGKRDKLPRGRKRMFDRFPPVRYVRLKLKVDQDERLEFGGRPDAGLD